MRSPCISWRNRPRVARPARSPRARWRRALNPQLVAIVGATGTGKTQLSLDLAEALERRGRTAEIVSADAMQLYRGMDIGTAKVPLDQRRGIPHHLLDVLDPIQEANVARYQADARTAIEQILERGAVPVLVGGSGLYVSSVIQDFRFPGTDAAIRARLEAELDVLGPGELHRRLAARDLEAAEAIGPHNGRRLVRALEVIELTGDQFGAGLPATARLWRPAIVIGLQVARELLVPRLDERAEAMWRDGLLDEVRELQRHGLGLTASRAIGYAHAISQLAGELDERQAIDSTAALTRRYARRQVGWFRRYRDVHWLDFADPDRLATALRLIVRED